MGSSEPTAPELPDMESHTDGTEATIIVSSSVPELQVNPEARAEPPTFTSNLAVELPAHLEAHGDEAEPPKVVSSLAIDLEGLRHISPKRTKQHSNNT